MPFFSFSMPSLRAALLGVDVFARVAVVGLVLVEDVAERVDVAVRVAVIAHAVGVGGEAAVHRVLERLGLSGAASVSGWWASDTLMPCLRRAPAACLPLRFGDQVRRAELIVRAPAAPVLHLLEHLVELLGVLREAGGRRPRGQARVQPAPARAASVAGAAALSLALRRPAAGPRDVRTSPRARPRRTPPSPHLSSYEPPSSSR